MRTLVTGGAGFLGSHLCDRLVELGHDVVVVDNLHTGSKKNLKQFVGNRRIEFQEADIINPLKGNYERIYNLACPASPHQYQHNAIATARTNFYGVDNLLQLASKCGARFFQASTSEVYGDALVHPQREDYLGNVNTIGPRSCYDEGKRIAETLCFDYRRQHNVDIKVARIFNTYGPRMDPNDGRVVSNFIVQALKNQPITIYGDGRQTRSFCYVDDLIDGFLRLMESPPGITGPINLGNPSEFTMLELAKQIIELTGSHSTLEFRALPQDDPKQRQPDISKAASVLQWQPKISLGEGLLRTISYFEARLRRRGAQ